MIVNHKPNNSVDSTYNETVNGFHNFIFDGYSLSKGLGPGKYISSDNFTAGGYKWAIYFYPDGISPEDSSSHVSIFIALLSDVTDVRALFELRLLDQSGNGNHKVYTHFDRAPEGGSRSIKYRGNIWGVKRFMRRSSLKTSDFLKNDCLSIQCTVGVVRNRVEGPKVQCVPVHPSLAHQQSLPSAQGHLSKL